MKADLKKDIPGYAARRGKFDMLELPAQNYLMIDGQGDPNSSPHYVKALEALYPLAYKLKFFSKKELDRDYTVMPLEGLWWAQDMDTFTTARNKSAWSWTMMILTPSWITEEVFEQVRSIAAASSDSELIERVRLESLHEGTCVQTLHVGSYDDEGPVLELMHNEFIAGAGLRMTGKHHEIYLSDPRRTSAEKLRTILRQPVTKAE